MFFQKEVAFLGHLISEEGTGTDPQKIKSVQEWPTTRNINEVRSFVGLAFYLRKFTPNFSTICKLLHELIKKGQKFEWLQKCETAFQTLKNILVTAPVLAFVNKEVSLYCPKALTTLKL